MKHAIGSVPTYNIVIIFIVITFGFLSATLSYYKAFKVNSNIAKHLERYEGYNSLSIDEIEKDLDVLGYRKEPLNGQCPTKMSGRKLQTTYMMSNYPVCIYESKLGKDMGREYNSKSSNYFYFGVLTYIYVDIPLVGGTFKIPVYTETERIFRFSS